MLLIKNGYIKTMAGPDLENGCVLIGDDGKILEVAPVIDAPETLPATEDIISGCKELDCLYFIIKEETAEFKVVKCVDCGKDIVIGALNTKTCRCEECQNEANKKAKRAYHGGEQNRTRGCRKCKYATRIQPRAAGLAEGGKFSSATSRTTRRAERKEEA